MPCSPRSILPSAPMVVATRRSPSRWRKKRDPANAGRGPYRTRRRVFCGLYRGAVDVRPPNSPLTDGVVRLRPWSLDDIPALAAACDDPEIARWMHQVPSPYTEGDALEYVIATQTAWRERRDALFAVVGSGSDGLVGSCAEHVVCPEVGEVH